MKKPFYALITYLMFLIILSPITSFAQSEEELKVIMTRKILDFVKWNFKSDDTIKLTVLGSKNFYKLMHRLYNKSNIDSKILKVKYAKNISELGTSDVIYFDTKEQKTLKKIILRTQNKPILLISSTKNSSQHGVHINYFRQGNKLRFEVNIKNLQKSKLIVSPQFLRLAKIID